MYFEIDIVPPTVTAQMKKVRVVNGKPMFYDPPKIKEARDLLRSHLQLYKPKKPFIGPVSLKVTWVFPSGKSHKPNTWRITRPDTDNLEKMLKDCMTQTGYWLDDAQVCQENIEKYWGGKPGIYISVESLPSLVSNDEDDWKWTL